MHYLVLETRPGSGYSDSFEGYDFPKRYLAHFAPLDTGEIVFAVLYEPRLGGGRRAYFGYTFIVRYPSPIPGGPGRRDRWWARYEGGIHYFRRSVPRLVAGEPVESWLRNVPLREQPALLQGRAVRPLADTDLLNILALAGELPAADGASRPLDANNSTTLPAERLLRTITILQRNAHFRSAVLDAYGWRCAVTGFGTTDQSFAGALVEAAHIKPVAYGGADDVCNGIAVTPTVHRLFDAGLISMRYEQDALRLQVSPHLDPMWITKHGSSFALPLTTGLSLTVPMKSALRPDPLALEFHRDVIFRR